jgi:hypothetical protein
MYRRCRGVVAVAWWIHRGYTDDTFDEQDRTPHTHSVD